MAFGNRPKLAIAIDLHRERFTGVRSLTGGATIPSAMQRNGVASSYASAQEGFLTPQTSFGMTGRCVELDCCAGKLPIDTLGKPAPQIELRR